MAVAHVATGVRSAGNASAPAAAYPAGVAANQLALLHVPVKPDTARHETPSGWGVILRAVGGVGTTGVDVGLTRLQVAGRVLTGSETGSVATTLRSGNSAFGVIQLYSVAAGKRFSIKAYSHSDATHLAARAHTFSNVDLAPGDMLVVSGASDTDSSTAYTSPTFAATGHTFNAVNTRLANGGVTTGNDVGNWIYETSVATGTSASVTVTFNLTGGPSSCGPAILIVLREIDPYTTKPTRVAYTELASGWHDNTTPRDTAAALTWLAGDDIFVLGVTEDDSVTLSTPTATGLTFTPLFLDVAVEASSSWVSAWWARAGSSGSDQITVARATGTQTFGAGAWQFRGSQGPGLPHVSVGLTSQTRLAPIHNDNSAVLVAIGDWGAGATGGTWSPAIGTGDTEDEASVGAGVYSSFVADWDDIDTSVGTFGYTHTSSGNHSFVIVPVLGDAGTPATDLVINNAAQAHAAESPALTQVHVLVIANAAQAQSAPASPPVPNLAVNNATQAQTADSPTLVESSVLAIANAAHAQSSGSPALTQVHNLAIAAAAQAQAAQTPALTQAHVLAPADAAQAQTAGALALTQAHQLAVQAATHGHTAENVTLTVSGADTLAINNAAHAHSAGSPTLTQLHVLVISAALQAQVAGAPVLTQVHQLIVQGAAQAHAVNSPTLGQTHQLSVAGAQHAHSAESPSLTPNLSVHNAQHAITSGAPSLTQQHILEIQQALQGMSSSDVVLAMVSALTKAQRINQKITEAFVKDDVDDAADARITDAFMGRAP